MVTKFNSKQIFWLTNSIRKSSTETLENWQQKRKTRILTETFILIIANNGSCCFDIQSNDLTCIWICYENNSHLFPALPKKLYIFSAQVIISKFLCQQIRFYSSLILWNDVVFCSFQFYFWRYLKRWFQNQLNFSIFFLLWNIAEKILPMCYFSQYDLNPFVLEIELSIQNFTE